MKKLFTLILVLFASFMLVACSADNEARDSILKLEETLNTKVSALEARIASLVDEIEDLEEAIDSEKVVSADLKTKLTAATAELAALKLQLTELETEIEALEGESQAALQALEEKLQEVIDGLIEEVDALKDQNSALAKKLEFYMKLDGMTAQTVDITTDAQLIYTLPEVEVAEGDSIKWVVNSNYAFVVEVEEGEFAVVIYQPRSLYGEAAQQIGVSLELSNGETKVSKLLFTLKVPNIQRFVHRSVAGLISDGNLNASYGSFERAVVGVVAGKGVYTKADGTVVNFYKVADTVKDEAGEVVATEYVRVLSSKEFEVGDMAYFIGKVNIAYSEYFTPKPTIVELDTAYVVTTNPEQPPMLKGFAQKIKSGVSVEIKSEEVTAFEIAEIANNTTSRVPSGVDYMITGRLFKNTVERFAEGGKDGDPLYETDIYFLEFAGKTVEFYGLSDAQKALFDTMNDKYVTLPAYYLKYEIMFGNRLPRIQLATTEAADIKQVTTEKAFELYQTLFEERLVTEYKKSEDLSISLPVGIYDAGYNSDIENLVVRWTFTPSDNVTASQTGGVMIPALAEEITTMVKVVVTLRDIENSTSEDQKDLTFTIERTYTLQSNMISHENIELTGYYVSSKSNGKDIDFLEGMLKDKEDEYWNDWEYPNNDNDIRYSNQDDARKIINGKRDDLFGIEVDGDAGINDPVHFEFTFDKTYEFTKVILDSGLTGNDKIGGWELYAYNEETEEWVKVAAVSSTSTTSTFDTVFPEMEFNTNKLRVTVTNGDQKYWGCCYTLRIAEIVFFGNEK